MTDVVKEEAIARLLTDEDAMYDFITASGFRLLAFTTYHQDKVDAIVKDLTHA